MSSIRQYQRRALERLRPKKDYSFRVSNCNMDEYYLDNQKIFLLGISEGIGTCSDLHGINIAVFGHDKPDRVRMPARCQEKEISCSWGVLLKEPAEAEFQKELKGKEDIPHMVVELIEPILIIEKEEESTHIYFVLTGEKQIYANII